MENIMTSMEFGFIKTEQKNFVSTKMVKKYEKYNKNNK